MEICHRYYVFNWKSVHLVAYRIKVLDLSEGPGTTHWSIIDWFDSWSIYGTYSPPENHFWYKSCGERNPAGGGSKYPQINPTQNTSASNKNWAFVYHVALFFINVQSF